jgi:7-carboxy-7-deazaguanine synthase
MAWMTVDDLVAVCNGSYHVVITGGEPCLYDLRPLVSALLAAEPARTVQVETSGTQEVLVPDEAWVTVSPKLDMPGGLKVLSSALERADEIKYPVGKAADVERLVGDVMPFVIRDVPVYLQPLSQSKRATQTCLDAAAKEPGWRVSIQTHKFTGHR